MKMKNKKEMYNALFIQQISALTANISNSPPNIFPLSVFTECIIYLTSYCRSKFFLQKQPLIYVREKKRNPEK